jgi:hypothetical protein
MSRQGEISNIDHLTLDHSDPTFQTPGLQGSFEYMLVSHGNSGARDTNEIGSHALGA